MQYSIMSKCKVRVSHNAGERVIVSVVELVSLCSHAGVTHDDISVIAEFQVNIVSGKRALENREFPAGVVGETCGISSALFAFL